MRSLLVFSIPHFTQRNRTQQTKMITRGTSRNLEQEALNQEGGGVEENAQANLAPATLKIKLGRTRGRTVIDVAAPDEEFQINFQAAIDSANDGYKLSSLRLLLRSHRVLHNGMSPPMILFEWASKAFPDGTTVFPNVAFHQDTDMCESTNDIGIIGTQMLTMVESLPMWDLPRFQGWTSIQMLSEFHKMMNMFPIDISHRIPNHASPFYTFEHINSMIFTYRSQDFHLFAAKAVARMKGSKENWTAFGNPECRVVGCTNEAPKGISGYCGKKACMDSLKCPYCDGCPRWVTQAQKVCRTPNYADHSCRSCRDKGMHKKA